MEMKRLKLRLRSVLRTPEGGLDQGQTSGAYQIMSELSKGGAWAGCSLVQMSLQRLPWAADFFSSPPPTRRPAYIILIPWLYCFVRCLQPETVWIHLALYPSWSPILRLDPMLNSGSEKPLGLYPGTSLIGARFFPSLMKGDQALLWSNIFLATVCFSSHQFPSCPGYPVFSGTPRCM